MRVRAGLGCLLCAVLLPLALGCGSDGDSDSAPHLQRPVLVGRHVLTEDGDTLQPVRLQLYQDTLYVSYNRLSRIDLYSTDLVRRRSIPLSGAGTVYPAAFVVNDSELIVADHAGRRLIIYDRAGNRLEEFGSLPDGITALMPFAVTYFGGVVYAADAGLHRVLAISLANAPGITERGELILFIPQDSTRLIGFPSALMVTPDGRMLVGDAAQGLLHVYTCDGRYVYDFDSVTASAQLAPNAFALDNVRDASLQDTSIFDPSGVRELGRVHVADGNNRVVHMYNSLGRYLTSYGSPDELARPSGIAIHRPSRTIFIADPPSGVILTYRYGA